MQIRRHLLKVTVLLVLIPACFCSAPSVDVEDYDTELTAWREDAENPEQSCNVRITGECDDGRTLFLHEFLIDSGRTVFFDADTREFVAYEAIGIFVPPIFCFGPKWYPYPVSCEDGVITEVLCGTSYEIGDPFPQVQ